MGAQPAKKGISLLVEYLDVCNAAVEVHRHSLVYRPIIAAYDSIFANRQVAIDIYDRHPDEVENTATIRLVNGEFVTVPENEADPSFHLKLGRRYMEDVVAHRDEYIQHPEKLDWDWMKSRMGMEPHHWSESLERNVSMPKTTVGLFENPGVVDDVVREIEALGLPRNEVRIVDEPSTFEVTGVMSFARLDFEVELARELTRIGATKAEAQAYIEGLRDGGALVLATGADDKVDRAAEVMNRRGAVEIEETSGPEPLLPSVGHENATPIFQSSVMTGRIRQPGGGACMFVW